MSNVQPRRDNAHAVRAEFAPVDQRLKDEDANRLRTFAPYRFKAHLAMGFKDRLSLVQRQSFRKPKQRLGKLEFGNARHMRFEGTAN